MAVPDFRLANCQVELTSSEHYDYPEALRNISVTVSHPELGDVANLEALLIDRSEMPEDDFIGVMDDESDDLQKLAVDVFDLDAKVKDRIVNDDHHKGTGCWGAELNDGHIIYLSDMTVADPYRGKGVGTLAIHALKKSEHLREEDFIMAWPFPHPGEGPETHARIVSFFHKNGFRRVGRTQFFAFSPNPAHRSHTVSAEDDAPDESGYGRPAQPVNSMTVDASGPTPAEANRLFALHYGIGRSAGLQHNPFGPLVPPQSAEAILELVNNAYATDPASITRRDEDGWTPLHVAAMSFNVDAVRALLTLPVDSGVQTTVTARGSTQNLAPLDLIERKLETDKAFNRRTAMLGFHVFAGHDARAIRCVYLLKKSAGAELWTETERNNTALNLNGISEKDKEDRFVELRRFECSCSCCIGCISPRMRYALSVTANEIYGIIDDPAGDPKFSRALRPEYFDIIMGLDYIPINVRRNVTRTWYKAYQSLFALIHNMLDSLKNPSASHTLPTPASLLEHARTVPVPPYVFGHEHSDTNIRALLDWAYLPHGGRIDFALDAVAARAKESSARPVGDGTFEFEREDAEDEVWAALPTCKNDTAWVMVRENMGIGKMSIARGPYYSDEGEDTDVPSRFGLAGMSAEDVELFSEVLSNYPRRNPGGWP
ncbi:hypothetical protein EIP86_002172 [Pleurotus ostreatoroseus]|nr:hypothetical protein EIP86_002172 [Pleurotus ostreatoroseus]